MVHHDVTRPREGVVIAAGFLAPLAICALLSTVRATVSAATAVLILVLVVLAAAAAGYRSAGLLTAASSALWFDFFLTQPYLRFTIADPDDVEVALLLLIIGAASTEVALWGRRQAARASRRAGYLEGVIGVAAAVLAPNESAGRVTDKVSEQLVAVLGVDRCHFIAGPVRDRRVPVLRPDGSLIREGRAWDVDRDGLPVDTEIAILVGSQEHPSAHFLLTSSTAVVRPSLEQRRVAVLLAEQTAPVVDPQAGRGPDLRHPA